MKKISFIFCLLICLSMFGGCKSEEVEVSPEIKNEEYSSQESNKKELTNDQIDAIVVQELYLVMSNLWCADDLSVENTRYDIGSITRTSEGWEVKGTVRAYDKYGDYYELGSEKWTIEIDEDTHSSDFEWE